MSSVNPHIVKYIYNVLMTLDKDTATVLIYDAIHQQLTGDGVCPCDRAPAPHSEESCPVLMNGEHGQALVDLMSILREGGGPIKSCFHCLLPYTYDVIPKSSPLHIPHTNHRAGEENHCEDLLLTPLFVSSLKLLLIPEICSALRFPSGQHGFLAQHALEYCRQDWGKKQGFTNLHLLFLINHFLYYTKEQTPHDAKHLLKSFKSSTPVTAVVHGVQEIKYLRDVANLRSGAQSSNFSTGTFTAKASHAPSTAIPTLPSTNPFPPLPKYANNWKLPNLPTATPGPSLPANIFERSSAPLQRAQRQKSTHIADSRSPPSNDPTNLTEILHHYPFQLHRSQAGVHRSDSHALTSGAERYSPYRLGAQSTSAEVVWTPLHPHRMMKSTEVKEEVQANGDHTRSTKMTTVYEY